MHKFPIQNQLPPYIFQRLNIDKQALKDAGIDIFEFGMGNPDMPTPKHIVEKMVASASIPENHRYSLSQGNDNLRETICAWYRRRYDVTLDPKTEAVVTIGSKEGLSHLALATVNQQDAVLVPEPCYPIHYYGFKLAGATIYSVPIIGITEPQDFIKKLEDTLEKSWPKPKLLLLNFPANPTTQCVDLNFFETVVAFAKKHKLWIIHDLAYADLVFDGYQAPSILQVPGAKEIAIEAYTLSKSYNMPGWRVGFMCGNQELVAVLRHLKSYMDYGLFTPLQEGAIAALEGPQDCVLEICENYRRRRDHLCDGLTAAGWKVEKPKATMFLWAKIPEVYRHLNSMDFTRLLLHEAHVAVSPGIGFGEAGDAYVRFALIQNEARIEQACENIHHLLHKSINLKAG